MARNTSFCRNQTFSASRLWPLSRDLPPEKRRNRRSRRADRANSRASTLQQFQCLGMQFRGCRSDDIPSPFRASALPSSYDAACLLNDRDQRYYVVRLQPAFDHQVHITCRQHAIGIAVGAVARQAHRLFHPVIGLPAITREQEGARRAKSGCSKINGIAHSKLPLAVRPCIARAVAVGIVEFACEGLGHHAGNSDILDCESNERTPERETGNEGARAINRIDHPLMPALLSFRAIFLANDAVIGKFCGNDATDCLFRGTVSFRYRVETSLIFVDHIAALAKPRQGFRRCGCRQTSEKLGRWRGGHASFLRDAVRQGSSKEHASLTSLADATF